MPRDGAGTYTRTHADYVYGEIIDQVAVNAELNDIATALTGSLTGKFWWGGTAGGTADARTITPSPSISAYAAGQEWVFINGAAANATATPTLAISGLAARTGKRADGSALVPGDWPANALIRVIDDGTNLRLAERMDGSFSGSFTGTGSIIQAEGAAVASAATTNIWANDGDTVHITGTTTITSFGTAVQAGQRKMIIFDGALTLTHGANLSLPGSANITTAAGDMALVYADTTTQLDVLYFKKSGTPIALTGNAPTVQIFTSSGTYTKPAGLVAAIVEVCGGGGGGGGVASSSGLGAGGGGGGASTMRRLLASAIGATETVTIGAAGAGGDATGGDGGAGGTSSFGSLVDAPGGGGGGGATGVGHDLGGLGGVPGTNGDVFFEGADGAGNVYVSSTLGIAGGGGPSRFGGGGRGRNSNSAGVGDAGGQFGGGGGGSYSTGSAHVGGAGFKGVVIVTEYY